jgi:L-ascorbate metabolism protein UlaG (beta-lactamase superfamily)
VEVQYHGANCVRLVSKKASITVDDNLSDLGLKPATKKGDIALYTGPHAGAENEVKLIIDQPGEYEVSNTSIQGVSARAHIDEEGQKSVTVYKIISDELRIAVVGHIHPDLTDEQLEALGTIDVLIVPVGGNGFTLDGVGALKVIKKIDPKLIIPTHYADVSINYPVPQQELQDALKNVSMEASETTQKLKIKSTELTDVARLVVLERQ